MRRWLILDKKKGGRRIPGKGFFFALLRGFGMFLLAVGLLVIIASGVMYILLLLRSASGILRALHVSIHQFAMYMYLLTVTRLIEPLLYAQVGILLLAFGFLFHLLATRPAPPRAAGTRSPSRGGAHTAHPVSKPVRKPR